MENMILESGTIVKTQNGEDFKIQTTIDISMKEDILKFIGDTPWNKVKITGHDYKEKINTTLNSYECIEDLLQCCEFNPPEWLSLKIGKNEFEIIV
jgi:hypothetical protein